MHKLISKVLIGLSIISVQAGAKSGSSSSSSGSSFSRSEYGQELVLSATRGKISFAGGNSMLEINGMYGHFFMPNVEGALELNFINSSGGGTIMTIFFDGIYNFQADTINSYFAFGGFGINSYSGRNNSSSTSSMKFGGGKRLQMWGQVSLMPMIWLQKDGSADMVTNIMPLNFSLLF